MAQEQFTNDEMLLIIQKVLSKSVEVAALLRDGKIIVAHEKLGGIIKNLVTCEQTLVRVLAQNEVAASVDK